jgi:hypothetical protein
MEPRKKIMKKIDEFFLTGVLSRTVDLSIPLSAVGEIPWFLCASAEKFHARGPLPVKDCVRV